ncbi:MAG TPA: protein kinase [Aquabacterium sp.]|nr:protein kinase [Aquabacterium sp.]
MTQLGRYQLKSVLGRGAMGLVYEALDPRLDRRVAIKTILKSHLLDDSVAQDYSRRFVREAQAAARLTHPHIVTVFDFGEEDEVAYIVMEFIEGCELAQHFENQNYFALPEAVRILCELLDALAYAHDRGIVHRDVKPANVMIDRAGHVKLTDFGVARLVETGADRTMPGTMVGTPSYMSPEQIQGLAVGSRTDLFAVGVILYQFLTHQRPFGGGGQWAVQRKILHEDPAPPSQLAPASPRIFDAIALRALAKNPDHRFQSATAFAAELRLALQTLPAAASPPARPEPQSDITVMLTRPRPSVAAPASDNASTLPGSRSAPVATAPAPQRTTGTTASAPMTPLDIARSPVSTWLPPRPPVAVRGLAPMSGGPAPMPPRPREPSAARPAATPPVSPYARRQPSRGWLAGLAAVATLPVALLIWRPGQDQPAADPAARAASAVQPLARAASAPVPTVATPGPRDDAPPPGLPPSAAASPPLPATGASGAAARTSMDEPRPGPPGARRASTAADTEARSKVTADRRTTVTARGPGARCAELTQRLQLGEALSPEHLEIFQKECKR